MTVPARPQSTWTPPRSVPGVTVHAPSSASIGAGLDPDAKRTQGRNHEVGVAGNEPAAHLNGSVGKGRQAPGTGW